MSSAQANVAAALPAHAAFSNPSALAVAASHVQTGPVVSASSLSIDSAEVDDVSTFLSLGWQNGWELFERATAGVGVSALVPTTSVNTAVFRPDSEPLAYRFETDRESMQIDTAVAFRWSGLALGVGASIYVTANSRGMAEMSQDRTGPNADGDIDASARMNIAPLAAVGWTIRSLSLAFRARGAHRPRLSAGMKAIVRIPNNTLNGASELRIAGFTSFTPTTYDMALAWKPSATWIFMADVQLARWSQASPLLADTSLDLQLGLNPDLLERSQAPVEARDTFSPRAALRGPIPWTGAKAGWTLGVAYRPQAFAAPQGWSTVLDSACISTAAGAAFELGTWGTVRWNASAAVARLWLMGTSYSKPSPVDPFAEGSLSGHMTVASAEIGGVW